MRRWKPKLGTGLWVGVLLLLVALGGSIFFGVRLTAELLQPPELWPVNLALYTQFVGFVGALLATGLLTYRLAGALTLSYEMDRNGLYILWVGNRAVIPINQIANIDVGATGSVIPWNPLYRIGYFGGRGRNPQGNTLHMFTTLALSRSLLIHTDDNSYAISPADQDSFVQELEQRRRLGAVKPLAPAIEPGRIFLYAFWNDPVVRRALVVAFGLNLLLLGVLAWRYPDLAPAVAMRFDAAAQVTELRPRHQVLFLPMAAFGLSVLNTGLGLLVYRRSKTGAQLLQLGSVIVQVLFGIAMLTIIAS
jgi:hypothetical protein